LKKDKDLVLAAVTQNGEALEWANDNMKKDKQVVVAAVSQNGFALEYAHDTMKADKDVILAAINQLGGVVNAGMSIKEAVLAGVKKTR